MRFVHECARFDPTGFGALAVEAKLELPVPIECGASLRHSIVDLSRSGKTARDIACVGGDSIGDASLVDLFFVGQPEMFGGCHIAQKRSSVGGRCSCAD